MKLTAKPGAALAGLLMLAAGLSVQAAVAPAASAATGSYPFTNAVCQSATDTFAGVQYCAGSDWALNGRIFDPNYGGYAYRNCTDWVAYRLKTKNGYTMPSSIGDASAWGAYFTKHGLAPNTTPAVGAIAWDYHAGADHVAYVEAVNGSQVTISEYNEGLDPRKAFNPAKGQYWTSGAYDTRVVASSAFKYIHVKDIPQTLSAQPTSLKGSMSSTSAALTWTETSGNVASFVSQYRIGSGSWTAGPSVGANARSMTVTGLKASTTYTFQVGARNAVGTHWSAYFTSKTAAQPTQTPPPPAYHAGRQVRVASQATGGDSGHTGPNNDYLAGPLRSANSPLWIVCYVNGQQIKGPYDTTPMWDLSDDGYYYSDAWLYTGTNGAAVPACALKTVTIASQATGGVSGHQGPGNQYKAGPNHAKSTPITIACYVTGQQITGPYDTTTMWDLSTDGYYYTDAWLYTGTNGAAVPHC